VLHFVPDEKGAPRWVERYFLCDENTRDWKLGTEKNVELETQDGKRRRECDIVVFRKYFLYVIIT
jgi:hypothetical protein